MTRRNWLAGAAIFIAAPALAHEGPRIWIDNVAGTVTAYTSDNDISPSVYTPARVFGTELLNFGVFTTEFPGFEVRRAGANVSPGTLFGFNLAGPVLFYDDVAQSFLTTRERFGPPSPGPIPQIAVSLDETLRFSGDGPVGGFNFLNYLGSGDHGHISFTLVADQAPYNGPAGVFALPMTLTGTGLAESEVYMLLLAKGVSMGSTLFTNALDTAQAMIDRPADANLDGVVNAADLGALGLHWQAQAGWSRGDFNFDGRVTLRDLMILAEHWQDGSASLTSGLSTTGLVPEPAGLGVLGIFGLAAIWRRRRN